MNAPVTENLSCEVLFETSQWIDWIEAFEKERCEIIYPDFSEFSEFSEFSLDDFKNITGEEFESGTDIQQSMQEYFYENTHQLEPMYNYAYPLPHLFVNSDVAQAILVKNSNVCTVVILDDEPVLALAGAGMDFSWDICRAYILLGYLPPFHFCDLPKMAGYSDDLVRDACIESCEAVKGRATGTLERLKNLTQTT